MGWIGLGLLGITIAAGSYFCLKKCKDGNCKGVNIDENVKILEINDGNYDSWLLKPDIKNNESISLTISIPHKEKSGEYSDLVFCINKDLSVKLESGVLNVFNNNIMNELQDDYDKLYCIISYMCKNSQSVVNDNLFSKIKKHFNTLEQNRGNSEQDKQGFLQNIMKECYSDLNNNKNYLHMNIINMKSLNDINSEKKQFFSSN